MDIPCLSPDQEGRCATSIPRSSQAVNQQQDQAAGIQEENDLEDQDPEDKS